MTDLTMIVLGLKTKGDHGLALVGSDQPNVLAFFSLETLYNQTKLVCNSFTLPQ